uniref:Transforming growth factor beta 1 induced transcript 1 n=1 Tax=Xenopus tropicalis TaxID=8364 RepID=F6YN22_XENTR
MYLSDALLADLQITTPPRCPVLLTDSPEKPQPTETRPPPPPYDPRTAMSNKTSDHETIPVDKDHLYSTVQKYPLPSVSPALGGGLCELDRLLNELNATQFNITDEIMSQFPTRDRNEQKAEAQKEAEKRALSASSATLELDRLMASLSDFHKQNTVSQEVEAPGTFKGSEAVSRPGDTEDLSSPRSIEDGVPKASEDAPSPKSFEVVSAPVHLDVKTDQVISASRVPDSVSGCKVPEATSGPRSDLDSMLVKLQSGLKLQGIETQSKGLCESCQRPIAGQVVTALGHTWHPEHFVCVCHTPFINGSFFEHEGLPLCETHYHSRRGSLCAGCEQPITGRCVTAMGKKFHPQHLNCTFCLRQLNKGTFREHDGKPYCQACYARLYG